ncbi:hypothetical protein SBOR_6348 [Sclerotinia borealis F-4128]|uniref:Uncharacterized protein n=1 Tax=Sclerotinia borealis (strain F-4128) TaxID=1432307 RepID=W9CBQ1_SCLBF|nr:hypothetical protein SBOR_6348 [Sclerotinia borealis F-4128]
MANSNATSVETASYKEPSFRKLKENLRVSLDGIKKSSAVFHNGSIPDAVNPGIFIEGHGIIGFPLTEYDFARIIAASGSRSGESDVDTLPSPHIHSVPGIQISTRNPDWESVVESVLEQVKVEIGLGNKSASSELSALMYYEPGSTMEIFDTSELTESDFGVLDIILPSAREGEEFIVQYGGKKSRIQGDGSEWDPSFLAWFTDVPVSSTPLSSGHRLIVRYKLRHTAPGETSSAAALKTSLLDLQSILKIWNKNQQLISGNVLGYVLSENRFSRTSSINTLSEQDRHIFNQLKEVCEDNKFDVYLSRLDKLVKGQAYSEPGSPIQRFEHCDCSDDSCDEGGLEHDRGQVVREVIREETLELTGGIDLEDEVLHEAGPSFSKDNLVNGDDFDSALTYEELEENDDEHSERRSCFTYTIKASTADREVLAKAFRLILPESDPWSETSTGLLREVFSRVLISTVDLDEKCLFHRALPLYFSSPEYHPLLAVMKERHGSHWLLAGAESHISQIDVFHLRCKVIENLSPYEETLDWSSDQYEVALSSSRSLGVRDAASLTRLAKGWSEKQLIKLFLPAIKKNLHVQRMLCAILTHVSSSLSLSKYTPQPLDLVFQELLSANFNRLVGLDLNDWPDDFPLVEGENGYDASYISNKGPTQPRGEPYETPPQGVAKVSDDDFQEIQKVIAYVISKTNRKPTTSNSAHNLQTEVVASFDGKNVGGAGVDKKRGFTSNDTPSKDDAVADDAQIKRFPAQNQWHQPGRF